MAHLDGEAGNTVDDLDSAAAALADFDIGGPEDDQPEEDLEAEPEEDEGEAEEDQDDGDDEQDDEPAIDAPVSLTAEEKAKFAALPKDAQQYVADLEARRATQVQTATTKAAEAQRTAETRAAQADAQAQARFARQLEAFADNLAPQRPDPALASTNPSAYIAQNAQYEVAKAQHDELVQQVQALGADANTAMSEAEVQQRDRELMAIPEVANEATREEWFKQALGAADILGLDRTQIGHASAAELKALHQVAGWREKAEKYDAATARQMQRVRDGKKTRTTKPNAAQPSSAEGRGYRESRERLRSTGKVDDAAAALARMGFK